MHISKIEYRKRGKEEKTTEKKRREERRTKKTKDIVTYTPAKEAIIHGQKHQRNSVSMESRDQINSVLTVVDHL